MLAFTLKPLLLEDLAHAFCVQAEDDAFLEDNASEADDICAIDDMLGRFGESKRSQSVTLSDRQWGIVAIECDCRADIADANDCRRLSDQCYALRDSIRERSPIAAEAYRAYREIIAQLNREAAAHLATFAQTKS